MNVNYIVKDVYVDFSSLRNNRIKVDVWLVGDLEGQSISCFSGSTSASQVLGGVFHHYLESSALLEQ